MKDMRILHVPCNVPYIQKLHSPGSFISTNGDISTPTFSWIANQYDQQFWDSFDICHIHFGFEFEAIEVVEHALKLLSMHGKIIVFTLHEFSSVHGVTVDQYSRYIDLVLRYSVRVITLTEGARRILDERFSRRDVVVIPHGKVANVAFSQGGATRSGEPRILMCGALRSNREMAATFVNLVLASDNLYQVHLVTRPFTTDQLRDDQTLQVAISLHRGQHSQVRTVMPLSDEDVVRLFLSYDALILPYREAGHSGQLELAFDCGFPVIASDVGFLPEQPLAWPTIDRDSVSFINWSDGKTWLYQQRLVAVVKSYISTPFKDRRAETICRRQEFRETEHKKILAAHASLYREVIKLNEGG